MILSSNKPRLIKPSGEVVAGGNSASDDDGMQARARDLNLAEAAMERRAKQSKLRILRIVVISDREQRAYTDHSRFGPDTWRVLRDGRGKWHTHKVRRTATIDPHTSSQPSLSWTTQKATTGTAKGTQRP